MGSYLVRIRVAGTMLKAEQIRTMQLKISDDELATTIKTMKETAARYGCELIEVTREERR